MNKQLPYEIKDDVIPTELRKEVWEYIRGLEHYAMLKDAKYPQVGTVVHYHPEENKKEYYDKSLASWNNQFMHRVTFGNTEEELLIHRHRPIHRLWKAINAQFGNKFEIAGDKEGCYAKNDKNLMQRVYVNVQPNEEIKRSHGVHRDTIDLDEDKNYTLLYIANMEWYPTWFGELMFYENDDTYGDKQQYQKGWGQSRNFGVGYPYATIPSIPGRIIVYDGRTLHTTRPVAEWADQFRYSLAFRVRLKD